MFSFPGEGPGDTLRMRAGELLLSEVSDIECETGPTDIFLGDLTDKVWEMEGVLARRVGVPWGLWECGTGVFR